MKLNKKLLICFGPLGQPSELLKEDLEELKKKKILLIRGSVVPVYPRSKMECMKTRYRCRRNIRK